MKAAKSDESGRKVRDLRRRSARQQIRGVPVHARVPHRVPYGARECTECGPRGVPGHKLEALVPIVRVYGDSKDGHLLRQCIIYKFCKT